MGKSYHSDVPMYRAAKLKEMLIIPRTPTPPPPVPLHERDYDTLNDEERKELIRELRAIKV
jgi:hypothetical protein